MSHMIRLSVHDIIIFIAENITISTSVFRFIYLHQFIQIVKGLVLYGLITFENSSILFRLKYTKVQSGLATGTFIWVNVYLYIIM